MVSQSCVGELGGDVTRSHDVDVDAGARIGDPAPPLLDLVEGDAVADEIRGKACSGAMRTETEREVAARLELLEPSAIEGHGVRYQPMRVRCR